MCDGGADNDLGSDDVMTSPRVPDFKLHQGRVDAVIGLMRNGVPINKALLELNISRAMFETSMAALRRVVRTKTFTKEPECTLK